MEAGTCRSHERFKTKEDSFVKKLNNSAEWRKNKTRDKKKNICLSKWMINKHKSLKKTKVKKKLYYLSTVNNFISSFKIRVPLHRDIRIHTITICSRAAMSAFNGHRNIRSICLTSTNCNRKIYT